MQAQMLAQAGGRVRRFTRRLSVALAGLVAASALMPALHVAGATEVAQVQCCPALTLLPQGPASIAVVDPVLNQQTRITTQGRIFTVIGSGFRPGAEVSMTLDSPDGLPLGPAFAPGGSFETTLLMPLTTATGYHTLFATDGSSQALYEVFIAAA